MGAELILLPTTDESAWRVQELEIRALCAQVGLQQDAIKWVCADIKPRVLAARRSVSLDASEQFRAAIQLVAAEVAKRHIQRMVMLEIELYAAIAGTPTPYQNWPEVG